MRILVLILTLICFYPLTLSAVTLESNDVSGLHLDWLNKNVDPAKNFFSYANGTWQKNNPIPAAYASWGTFNVLHEQNQLQIKNMLYDLTIKNNPTASDAQKMADFYLSGMDEIAINEKGSKPLKPEFERINQIQNLTDLQKTIAHFHMIGVGVLFDFGQMQDFKDSRNVIGIAAQGGLSLPDRDYYLKNEVKFNQIRQTYLNHIAKMFALMGDKRQTAKQEAATVMKIEMTLAKASMSRIEQRDPHAIYHPMDLTQLQTITPHFAWQTYFSDLGHAEINHINLAMPSFFKIMDEQLQTVSLADWKIYLRWHLISEFAPYLSEPFVKENFRMHTALTGVKEILPRWKRVVSAEQGALGFAIGKLYVEKYFPPSSKVAVQEILSNIRLALKKDLQNLAWMTPDTRKAAILKLDQMSERIGYPDKWWDYSTLNIDRGSYVLNIVRANEFLSKHELNKIGKPVDKDEWEMTPQTINAYYNPSRNELNIPAGILQPPFFDPKAPAAVNYGAIGFVMGHEMTHGFDDQGAQFDGQGNLKNWWTEADLNKFKAITQAISNQYSQYVVDGQFHVQGKLVTGEAAADLGGLTLAYRAFHLSKAYSQSKAIHGVTPDQQFFLGAAHIWAKNTRPDEARHLVIVDPHPPALYRVNGTLANMAEFRRAFGFAKNSPMVNKKQTQLW